MSVLCFREIQETALFLDLSHNHQYHNNVLIIHPFGYQTDASQHLLTLPDEGGTHSIYTVTYKSGGGSESCHINDKLCLNYINENFWAGESKSNVKSNIVIPHLEQLDQRSNNFKIANKINCILPKNDCFFFTRCNFFNYLKLIGCTEDKIESKYNGRLSDGSNTMILYPDNYNVVIIITLPESENDSLQDLHLKADANVKAYQTLHKHSLIGDDQFLIISVVGAVYHKKEVHPFDCKVCDEELIIYSDDFKNEKSLGLWWKRLEKMIKETTDRYSMEEEDKVKFRLKIASMLVVMGAITEDRFPSLNASVDERIEKVLLNEAQRNILFDPLPKKIIKG